MTKLQRLAHWQQRASPPPARMKGQTPGEGHSYMLQTKASDAGFDW